jgi:predicted TPR repeat methyltransferase
VPAAGRFPQTHFLVALIQGAPGAVDKQLTSLENAVKLDPTYALAWFRLGQMLAKAGQADKAAAAFERFLELAPEHEAAKRLLQQIRPA